MNPEYSRFRPAGEKKRGSIAKGVLKGALFAGGMVGASLLGVEAVRVFGDGGETTISTGGVGETTPGIPTVPKTNELVSEIDLEDKFERIDFGYATFSELTGLNMINPYFLDEIEFHTNPQIFESQLDDLAQFVDGLENLPDYISGDLGEDERIVLKTYSFDRPVEGQVLSGFAIDDDGLRTIYLATEALGVPVEDFESFALHEILHELGNFDGAWLGSNGDISYSGDQEIPEIIDQRGGLVRFKYDESIQLFGIDTGVSELNLFGRTLDLDGESDYFISQLFSEIGTELMAVDVIDDQQGNGILEFSDIKSAYADVIVEYKSILDTFYNGHGPTLEELGDITGAAINEQGGFDALVDKLLYRNGGDRQELVNELTEFMWAHPEFVLHENAQN